MQGFTSSVYFIYIQIRLQTTTRLKLILNPKYSVQSGELHETMTEVQRNYSKFQGNNDKLPTGTIKPCQFKIFDSSTWMSRNIFCPDFLISCSSWKIESFGQITLQTLTIANDRRICDVINMQERNEFSIVHFISHDYRIHVDGCCLKWEAFKITFA